MAVCPNKNSQEWKDLVEKLGVNGAYRVWLENNRNIPNVHNLIRPKDEDLIRQFTAATNSVVLIDREMAVPGRGEIKENGDILVYINPDILEKDTIIHEFGEVYISLLGGIENKQVQVGLKKVLGTPLEAEVAKNYPELLKGKNLDRFHKELVITALGRRGEEIFNASEQSKIRRFNTWLKGILAKLSRMLGMPPDVIQQFATEILQNKLRKDEFVNPAPETFEQRPKQTPENAINRIIMEAKDFEISEDENFYMGKKGTSFEGLKIERQSKYAERVRGKDTTVNEFMKRGAHVGNFLDDLGRDVFKMVFEEDDTALQTREAYLAGVNNKRTGKPAPEHSLEVSNDVFEATVTRLRDIAVELKDKGYTAISEGMFVYSLFHENIQKELGYDGVGGTLDLIVRDPKGVYHIIDFKNSKYHPTYYNDNLYKDTKMDDGKIKEALVDKWGVQQTIYKILTEQYSSLLNIGTINALVLSTEYTSAKQTGSNIILNDMKLGHERDRVIDTHRSSISEKIVKLFLNKPIAERTLKDITEGKIAPKEVIDESFDSLDERSKLLERAKKNIEKKISKLKSTVKGEDDINQVIISKFSKLIADMADLNTTGAIIEYVKQAYKEITDIREKLEEVDKIEDNNAALKSLYFIDITSRSFDKDTLIDITLDFQKDSSLKEYTSLTRQVIAMKGEIDKIIYTSRIDLLSKMPLVPHNKVLADYEQKAERHFNKNNPNLKKGEERDTKKQEYMKEFISDNLKEIEKKSAQYRKDALTRIPKDLSWFEANFYSPKDQNSDIVDMVVYLAEIADMRSRNTFLEKVSEVDDILSEYENFMSVSQGNQKEFYRPLLREEGGRILPELITQGDTIKYKELKKGKYKGTPVEELYDLFISMSNMRDGMLIPSHKLGNVLPSLNKDGLERVLEDGLIAAIKRGISEKFKLGSKDTDLGSLTSDIEDFTHKLTDSKRVLVNEANEEKAFIPINYRAKVEDNDRSFDVATLLLLDLYQAANFQNKTEALYIAESIRATVVNDRSKVVQRAGMLKRVKVNAEGDIMLGNASESKHLQALDNVIRQRIYGQQYVGDPQLVKAMKALRSYASFTMLSFNYMSGGANYFHGSAMAFIEGVGGEHYTLENVKNAKLKVNGDYMNVMSDIAERAEYSKTLMLTNHLDARNNFGPFKNNMSKNSKLKNLTDFGSFYFFNAAAEYSPQTLLMYSTLDNIKVLDKDGNYLTKDGKPTKDRKGAMSWDDAISVGYKLKTKYNTKTTSYKEKINEEEFKALQEGERNQYVYGVLVSNPLAVTSEISNSPILSEQTTFKIAAKAKSLNRRAFGNYSDINKAYFEATAMGLLLFHMRGFMIPGILQKFRGATSLLIKDDNSLFRYRVTTNDELRLEDKYFNQETNSIEQGMYTTTIRYFARLVEDLKALKFQIKGEKWDELTDHERANVKKTITELALGIAVVLASIALVKAADDDDDENLRTVKLLAAFYSRRLYSELFFYTNPVEALRVFKSPAVSISLIDGMTRALMQVVTGPTEIYDRGRFKDQSKVKVKFMKLTPLKAFQRDVESALNFFNY